MEPFQREPSCLHTALFGGHISASHDWTLMTACVSHDLRQLSLPLLGASSRTLVSGDLKGIRKMVGVQRILRTLQYRRGSSETKVYGQFLVEGNRPGLAGSLLKEAAETITRAWETRGGGLQASPARSDSWADPVVSSGPPLTPAEWWLQELQTELYVSIMSRRSSSMTGPELPEGGTCVTKWLVQNVCNCLHF